MFSGQLFLFTIDIYFRVMINPINHFLISVHTELVQYMPAGKNRRTPFVDSLLAALASCRPPPSQMAKKTNWINPHRENKQRPNSPAKLRQWRQTLCVYFIYVEICLFVPVRLFLCVCHCEDVEGIQMRHHYDRFSFPSRVVMVQCSLLYFSNRLSMEEVYRANKGWIMVNLRHLRINLAIYQAYAFLWCTINWVNSCLYKA